jgi:hypothetical protein
MTLSHENQQFEIVILPPDFRKEEVTFLKKSNQKTFAPGGGGPGVAKARRTKSLFASFSSEKEVLASFACL